MFIFYNLSSIKFIYLSCEFANFNFWRNQRLSAHWRVREMLGVTFKYSPSNFHLLYIIYGNYIAGSSHYFSPFQRIKPPILHKFLNHVKELLSSKSINILTRSTMFDLENAMFNSIHFFREQLSRGVFLTFVKYFVKTKLF